MLDGLFGGLQLAQSASDQLLHLFASAKDGDSLLVLVTVDLYLVDQFLVDEFVLVDQYKQSVQFSIQFLVLIEPDEVFLAQFFLVSHDNI